jgi:hypothetical protein
MRAANHRAQEAFTASGLVAASTGLTITAKP